MIEYNDLLVFKDENPYYKFMYVYFEGHEFIFRSLTRKEYKNIMEIAQNDFDLEDSVCAVSCVYPTGYNFSNTGLAGLPSRLSEKIINMSGFLELDVIIDYFDISKKKLKIYDTQLMLFSKAAFPEYTLEEMENWTFEKLIDTATKAEYILNLKGYDVQITNKKEEFEEKIKKEAEKDIYTFGEELRLQGIDPMIFNKAMFTKEKEFLEVPIILGTDWQNEGVLDGIRKQMEKRKSKKLYG